MLVNQPLKLYPSLTGVGRVPYVSSYVNSLDAVFPLAVKPVMLLQADAFSVAPVALNITFILFASKMA